MKVHPRIVGASLLFNRMVDGKTRTEPPVQTLAAIRAQMAAHQQQARDLVSQVAQAELAIRAALQVGLPTAPARAELGRLRAEIQHHRDAVAELDDIAGEVVEVTTDHDAQGLIDSAQGLIDMATAPFSEIPADIDLA